MKRISVALLAAFLTVAALAAVNAFNGIAITTASTINGITPVAAINGQTVTSAASYTPQQTFGADTNNGSNIADVAGRTYVSSKVTADADYTITRLGIRIFRVDGGGAAADIVAEIRADNAGVPGTLLATSTNTVSSASVNTTSTLVNFDFAGQAVTNTTIYWLGLKANSVNASNYYTFRGGATSTGDVQQSTAAATWSALSTRAWNIITYVSP